MDVIDVPFEVDILLKAACPKPSLPDASFTGSKSRIGQRGLGTSLEQPSLPELALDPAPAAGVIYVVQRQRPDAMNVIGKVDNRNRLVEIAGTNLSNYLA
jgi:hypothetical protein